MITPPPSSSSSPPSGKVTYDVFLSFRGKDTRTNFTDHLFTALLQKGIHTFRDDEELVRGESIAPNLLKAIEESRYVIVVFSPNYADSAWCLDEIAKVADCMKETGQKVLPVFYLVDPSEVRRQTGDHFGKAFEKHQDRYKAEPDKVQRWKDALFLVANLSGWHLQDGSESKVIQEIVEKVFTELNKLISTSEGLVGMDSHLNELLPHLNIGGLDVRIIGICGMGGIGKTTIAQVVFERLRAQFEGDSFLENVKYETEKQGSTIHLQGKLLLNLLNTNVNVQNTKMGKDIIKHRLSTKRVLVVLDDVDQDIQLETLCHRTWFGPGSRIIITSRDEHLISAFGADKVHMVNALTDPEAFDLFRLKAFNEDETGEDFLKLSNEFLKYANGLPLAIKVLGSSVRGRSLKLWSSALKRLEKNPPKGIIDVLRVSFDGLEETEKKTFLDIACFFKGLNKDRVIRILDGCDDAGVEMDVQVLIDRSFVTLFGIKLWMHDLIQEMGREVVFQECREEPGKRSRLWLPKDIISVLDQSKATSAVQSIYLQCPTGDDIVHSIGNAFSNMDRLRLLKISNANFSGNISYLSNKLQYLEWHGCPLDSFPSDFQPEELVEVHMHFSRIKQLWTGRKGWSMLRHLDPSASPYLMSTPDFTDVPDLEKLVLQFCTSLVEIHPSLGFLKKLFILDMTYCKSIESLPPFTALESLQILILSQCSGLKKFPEIGGNMKSLLELYLDGTSIEELPSSIERFTGLTMLNLTDCKNLLHLPNTIGCLTSLKCLYLQGCSKLDKIPENLNGIECMEKLLIGGTSIRELSIIGGMKNLQHLSCRGCKCLVSESCKALATLSNLTLLDLSDCSLMDGEFLNDFSSMISLTLLDLSGNCFVLLPESLSQFSKLQTLHLGNCKQLQLLPKKLPSSLQCVWAKDCTSLTDYPNQIKELNSSESGVTTVISLNSSALGVSGISRKLMLEGESTKLLLTHHHGDGQKFDHDIFIPSRAYIKEKMPSSAEFSNVHAGDDIPEWFSTASTRNPISIRLPQNLADDNKWKGFAACAVFSVKGHTALSFVEPDNKISNYSYKITWETDFGCLKSNVLELNERMHPLRSSSHLRMIFYTSGSKFPEKKLNHSTVLRAKFETTDPSMVVQKCGIRLVYEQDAEWFSSMTNWVESVCMSELGDEVFVPQSACWFYPSLKWERCIPPLEDESTRVVRENVESVLPRYLEGLNSRSKMFEFNLRGSPGWFELSHSLPDSRSNSAAVPIEMPQNLQNNKKWMGMAIHASLVEEVGRQEDSYWVFVELKAGDGFADVLFPKPMHIRPSSEERHQLLVCYVPRAQISEIIGEASSQTLTTACGFSISIDSPCVKVQTCGFRIVYQEDIQGFADTILQCIQKEGSLKAYDKWLEERMAERGDAHLERMTERDSRTPREKYFDLHSQKYRNWDWCDPRPLSRSFERGEIFRSKWFMPFINQGNSAEIQLPPSLFDDDNWLGFAACSELSNNQYPNIGLGSSSSSAPDPEENVRLTYRLDSDVAWHGLFDIMIKEDIKYHKLCEYATDFIYIPRKVLFKVWRQSKLARITLSFSSPCLAVHSCALRLLFKEDVEDLVETLTLAELP